MSDEALRKRLMDIMPKLKKDKEDAYSPDTYTLIKSTDCNSGDLYVSEYNNKYYWLLEDVRNNPFDKLSSWDEINRLFYHALLENRE